MTRIAHVAAVLPDFDYSQDELTGELSSLVTMDQARGAVMRRLHAGTGIRSRSTVLPLADYSALDSFTVTNRLFAQHAADLAERAIGDALAATGLSPWDVDFLLFTTVTGVAAPSVDAVVASRLGMRPDLKRLPSFGLGCVAGAAGIARVHDYLLGHPGDVAVLLSVELCSLTLQHGDESMANMVASGLFGDGAAAVVMVGDDRDQARLPGPAVVATRSTLYPDTAEMIGWRIGSGGFEIMLTAGVPDVILDHFGFDVANFLESAGLRLTDVAHWIAHPGGPRVLEAFEKALALPPEALALSWRSLERVGNLSSAAVLHVLADTLEGIDPAPGEYGLLFALGPGVSAEFVLIRWPGEQQS
ncbi:type III polyketide synthase [Homoserinimonas sp. OAct 916]|uniref:type III polyketide synthase n=1 Tax=Homoserinimonas sp. OAct 916 TaxID=2211450 RepID=UPI000DBE54E7|nr:3-oxoacyl-[acyl-carrier-protein] synthase III C-terminal domain-containing protein [Homoserinimonas sp. OAct 916]